MLDEGSRLGVPLPLTSVAHQLCTELIGRFGAFATR